MWKKDKKSKIMTGILTVVLLILTALAFIAERGAWFDLPLGLLLSLLAGVYMLLKRKSGKVFSVLTAAVIPFLSMYCLQFYTCDPWRMYPMMLLVNCIFFYLFYLMLSFLLGSFSMGYTIPSVLIMVIGIANYFVIEFRSAPIVPWDLLSLGTAASVADNYTYTISWRLLFVTFGFVFLILTARKNTLRPKKLALRIPAFVLTLALLIASVGAIQKKEVKDWLGMDQTLFTPGVRYRNNGFMAAFLGNLYLINIKEPDGYSVKKVEEIQQEVLERRDEEQSASVDVAKMPNIIVVMNEAFSDLSVLGEFNTNEDYMPFFRSLMEDYTSGHLMVSVKGGNTANTEYEFLSGDTMAFLPTGSVVYQQYIKDEVPTLTSYLKNLGYSTTAIHPYRAAGWDRDTVYPKLGFEEFLDITDFQDPYYIRSYVSDQSAFEKIIEVFENKQKDEKKFIFEVTMQNHSAYSKEDPDVETQIKLTDYTSVTTSVRAAQNYLTLIRASDDAFKKLIEYFEKVEEPTVIIMFGDHLPSDYVSNVIARLTGYNQEDSLEENQRSYEVPYVIWDNMGLEKDDSMELTSVNYLAAYLMKRLDMPLTCYQEFLLNLKEELPVICAGTYINKEGLYHTYTEEDNVYGTLLNDYNILQYNHLTDGKHRVESMFQ